MACGGVVSDGGVSAHTSEKKPHHTSFSPDSLEPPTLWGCPHQDSAAPVGKVTLKVSLHDAGETSAATIPQGANAAAGCVVNQGEEALAVTAPRHGGYF